MRAYYLFFILYLLFFSVLQAEAGTQSQRRLALVIGNGDYQHSPLKNPVNDARDFAAVLKKLGFEVILKTNTSVRQFDQLIDQFGRRLEQTKGVGLFYYAGHGVQSRGKNYLIPISAELDRETDLKYNTIDAQRIIDEMEYAKNGLNIVILDACRDNPLTRSFRSGKRGLAKFDSTPSGLLLAYSTAPGKQASDGNGRNSPYTKQLLRSIQKDNMPLEMVFKDVIKNVKKSTRGQQTPWISSSVDGDFYFSESDVAMLSTQPRIESHKTQYSPPDNSTSQSGFELVFWQTINTKPSKEKYEAYLDQYPNGHFRSIAESEIREYKKGQYKKTPDVARTSLSDRTTPITIDTCHTHLSKNRLTSGRQGNAFDCYNTILSDAPDNQAALSGIKKIEMTYLSWANIALSRNKNSKARSYVSKLKLVNPDNKDIQRLEKELDSVSPSSSLSTGTASRTISYRNQTEALSDIRQQFYSAISDKDIILAEKLLDKVKSAFPNSGSYQDFELRYKQLMLQQESSKLYESLILESLENDDLVKAERYLTKMASLSQTEEQYLQLKKQYADKVESTKKVNLILTSNVNENTVLINGFEYGSTPLDLSIIKGDYFIELKKRGYPSQKLKLALYANTSQHLDLIGGFATGIAFENPPLDIEMMAIEPGCFNIGSPARESKRNGDERRHQVCIKDGFWMGKYEVTQKQWQDVMQKNPSYFDKCGSNCPVENIEFYEIQIFLQQLSNLTGQRYRLPTEAEWEFSARAGTETPFNTGACLDPKSANFNTRHKYNKCAVSKEDYNKSTIAVGSYQKNAWGLYDIHGNVSEWTCSVYNPHYDGAENACYSPKDEIIQGSADIEKFAVRGGSWQYKSSYSRSAARDNEFPNANNKRMGFRVVREK